MPKFSFPIPGRKHSSSKEKEKNRGVSTQSIHSPSALSGGGLSKAQRFFGTDNNLNIDSPTRDDESWGLPSSRSSAMSISISDSAPSMRSTDETGSATGSQDDRWETESGVFPRTPQLHEKASSTLLGRRAGNGEGSISSGGRLRNEDSSSTLKSYYDRQKSPLAISQQTSESSARDLALRKGLPSVVMRSPLLQVESVDMYGANGYENGLETAQSRNKEPKKKPAKLDLSMLFPKAKGYGGNKHSQHSPAAPSSSRSSTFTNASSHNSSRRKLTKPQSRESLRSQTRTNRATTPDESSRRQTNDTLSHLYDHYEHMPARSPHMDRIPESRVASLQPYESQRKDRAVAQRREQDRISVTSERGASPWLEPRSNMKSPPWDSSAASISSSHTRTSKRTNTSLSAISNSDLQQTSVLSLSSGSEGEDSDTDPQPFSSQGSHDKASRVLNGSSSKDGKHNYRHSAQPLEGPVRLSKQAAFRPIPEASLPDSRLSGPWSPPTIESRGQSSESRKESKRVSTKPSDRFKGVEPAASKQSSSSIKTSSSKVEPKESRRSMQKEPPASRKHSVASSKRSSQQPTPPLSPSSMVFAVDPRQSNRFMAVTKQEEALLEALRQKRAKMREQIIEEHERSPPRTANDPQNPSRLSDRSSASTVRNQNGATNKQRILLYLDTPISDAQRIDTAEPSPDLSDFLSYGSDEESTPRTSWNPPPRTTGAPRPDSTISANPKSGDTIPLTPTSAARLSAVGITNFKTARQSEKQRGGAGVRFVDDSKSPPQDFLMDSDEDIWGM